MSYVIYMKGRDGHDAHYWTGGFRANGEPTWGDVIENAVRFPTAREAYEVAGLHERLEDWRVGRR